MQQHCCRVMVLSRTEAWMKLDARSRPSQHKNNEINVVIHLTGKVTNNSRHYCDLQHTVVFEPTIASTTIMTAAVGSHNLGQGSVPLSSQKLEAKACKLFTIRCLCGKRRKKKQQGTGSD